MTEDSKRVVREVVIEGPASAVDVQVARSLHGRRDCGGGVVVSSRTVESVASASALAQAHECSARSIAAMAACYRLDDDFEAVTKRDFLRRESLAWELASNAWLSAAGPCAGGSGDGGAP